MINVKIRTFGVFKEIFGSKSLAIKFNDDVTVKGVVQRLTESLPNKSKRLVASSEINDLLSNALILVNGKEISVLNGLEATVSDGDEIVLLPVSHGG